MKSYLKMENRVMIESRKNKGVLAQRQYTKIIRIKNPDLKIFRASADQDINEHWEYMIGGRKKDIKNNFFSDIENRLCIILELRNVNGIDGSLFGKADDMVFQIAGENEYTADEDNLKNIEFLEVPRLDLIEYHKEYTTNNMVIDRKYGVNNLFKSIRNYESLDLLTAVLVDDIVKLGNIIRL